MIGGLLQNVAVTLVRRPLGADDARGNPTVGEPVPTPLQGCSVQPGAAPEALQGRDTTGIAWTVFVVGHPDVRSTDTIRLPGSDREYEIDGEPLRWPAGLMLSAQTVILLRRWEEAS
jgi:hypothetical protein